MPVLIKSEIYTDDFIYPIIKLLLHSQNSLFI
jgi:hypothetical protein